LRRKGSCILEKREGNPATKGKKGNHLKKVSLAGGG